MSPEESAVDVESGPEEQGSSVVFPVAQVVVLGGLISVQVLVVMVELLLRINVLHQAGSVPPFLVCLHQDGLWFNFADKLLGSLSEHGGSVDGTDEEDLLAIESLGEMHEGALEAVLSA